MREPEILALLLGICLPQPMWSEQSRAGALTAVWVLDESDEAIRDLSRAREDAVRARHKSRQRLQAMLLRTGHRYSGKTQWTAAHERYLSQQSFAWQAHVLTGFVWSIARQVEVPGCLHDTDPTTVEIQQRDRLRKRNLCPRLTG